jgi:hypothetical protein
VVGAQPGRCKALLIDGADGGDPQRFVWLPTTDPDAPDDPPPAPAPMPLCLPGQPPGRTEIRVCPEAVEQIKKARRARLRGQGDPLDGHRLYAQEKVAAGLASLDGHLTTAGITAEDWQLAGQLMAVSDATRATVQAELKKAAAETNVARGKADAAREVVKIETVEAAAIQKTGRTAQKVLSKRPGEWMTGAELRRAVDSRMRPYLADALDALVLAGVIEVKEIDYRGQVGHCYRQVSTP